MTSTRAWLLCGAHATAVYAYAGRGVEDRFVTNNLDTLLTALYVFLDDRVLPALGWSRDHRPGGKSALSDAELMCLAVAQHLLGIASERLWIRYARAHLTGMFPYLPGQSGYGKRLRRQGRAAGRRGHRAGPRRRILA
jgi:hypothetical protein